mmetsp:Transcript_20235/g.29051  ORF Transcript_20235/g.29051 Transcript_20235/m.29051 type:complete len:467 (+) Transcript_20235:130-1530(+)
MSNKEEENHNISSSHIHDHDHHIEEEFEVIQKEQHEIASQLSRLSELVQSEFTKLDHKIDAVCETVSQATSVLNTILEGGNECPKLFVVVPISKKASLRGDKGALHQWYEAVNLMFSDPGLLFCDQHSVRIYPLCAYSMEPVGSGVELLHPSEHIQEMSFALQMTAAVLSSVALSSYPLSAVLPGFDASIQASLRYVTSLRASLCLVSTGSNTGETSEVQSLSLSDTQQSIFSTLENAASEGKDLRKELQAMDPSVLSSIKPVANASYARLRSILEHADPGLSSLRELMCPSANMSSGEVQWVKLEHAEAWRTARVTGSNVPVTAPRASYQPGVHTHEQELPSCSPGACRNSSPESSPSQPQDAVPLSHWVLVQHPQVSPRDCEDVESLSNWLHTEAGLLHSTADTLAIALVLDNCPHSDRLRTRLYQHPRYLISLGVCYEDEEDIKKALRRSADKYSNRTWCTVS